MNWFVFGAALATLLFLASWVFFTGWLADRVLARCGRKASAVVSIVWIFLSVAVCAGLMTGSAVGWLYGGGP